MSPALSHSVPFHCGIFWASGLALSLSPIQVNDWQKDWVMFFTRQRIQPQMDMLEKGSGDRQALELWSALQVSHACLVHGAALCLQVSL